MSKNSRPKQWAAACANARGAMDQLEAAFDELEALRGEYEEWKDGLPDNLQDGAVADKLDAIVDMDFSSALDDAKNLLDEAEGADLPLGFGRD